MFYFLVILCVCWLVLELSVIMFYVNLLFLSQIHCYDIKCHIGCGILKCHVMIQQEQKILSIHILLTEYSSAQV